MKNFSKLALVALFIASGAFVTSCNDDDDKAAEPASLYAKLGGTTMVADPNNPSQMIEQGRLSYRSVVDSTITLIVSDVLAGEEGNLGLHFAPVLSEALSGNTTQNQESNAILRQKNNLKLYYENNLQKTKSKP